MWPAVLLSEVGQASLAVPTWAAFPTRAALPVCVTVLTWAAVPTSAAALTCVAGQAALCVVLVLALAVPTWLAVSTLARLSTKTMVRV